VRRSLRGGRLLKLVVRGVGARFNALLAAISYQFRMPARTVALLPSNFTTMTHVTHLQCSICGKHREPGRIHNLCECGGPFLVFYDLEKTKSAWKRDDVVAGPCSMWRYAPVLPVRDARSIVSLGEGMTPLRKTTRLGARLDARNLWVKDEGINPTGSFKARGLSCAVSMCVELVSAR